MGEEDGGEEAPNGGIELFPAPSSGDGKLDLSGLSFDERLAALSKQYENAVPISAEERKKRDEAAPEREKDLDEQFWKPEFWLAVMEDLSSVEWPRLKKVWQTLYISQIAFLVVVILVLLFDALFDSGIRTLVNGEPFTYSLEKIMKVAAETGRR